MKIRICIALFATILGLASCTSTPAGKPSTTDTTVHAPVATAPVGLDTPRYRNGQFVYILGRVKARVQWVDHQIPGCGCGGSDKVNYWVYHINILNEIGTIKSGWGTVEELFPTRDIDTVYVRTDTVALHDVLSRIERKQDELNDQIDEYYRHEIKQAVQNHD